MATRKRRGPRAKPEAKRLAALELIAAGRSSTEVAKQLGLNRATVNRWRADPEFDERLRELQAEQEDAVHALLVSESLAVARSIVEMAKGQNEKGESVEAEMPRIRAAQVFFELLGKHKGSPVSPAQKGAEAETEEDVLSLLDEIPEQLLERSLAARRGPRERDL